MPGKLNLSEFHKVTSALSGMQVGGPQVGRGGAPLAASEDYDQHGYAVPRDNVQVLKLFYTTQRYSLVSCNRREESLYSLVIFTEPIP